MLATGAFDDQARGYDAVAESALGRVLRDRVRSVVCTLIRPQDSVIDVGCGTGLDTAWLASRVTAVLALDPSSEMIRVARDRCAKFPNVTVAQDSGASFEVDEPVDLVIANFGVVNCVGEFADFGNRLFRTLKPGAHAVLVTMPRWCPIELAIGALTFNKGLLVRRRPKVTFQGIELRYASAHTLAGELGPDFHLVGAEALGLVLPPFEQRLILERSPRLLTWLSSLDRGLARFGARSGLGDHHILTVQRRS